MADALNIGVTAWSPLGGGVLTGKYNKSNKEEEKQQRNTSSSSPTVVAQEGNSRLEVQNEFAKSS